MSLRRGSHDVACSECGEDGVIVVGRRLSRERYRVDDQIPHHPRCPHARPGAQPRHLKEKGWVRQEKRANALVGARETLMSGAVNEDGDGRVFHGWRVEAKRTRTERYSLTQSTWTKLVQGALMAAEEPYLHVELNCDSRAGPDRRVVVRQELYGAVVRPPVQKAPGPRTATTGRVVASVRTPYALTLDPPGVVLTEYQFTEIVEKLNAEQDSERDLQEPRRAQQLP